MMFAHTGSSTIHSNTAHRQQYSTQARAHQLSQLGQVRHQHRERVAVKDIGPPKQPALPRPSLEQEDAVGQPREGAQRRSQERGVRGKEHVLEHAGVVQRRGQDIGSIGS